MTDANVEITGYGGETTEERKLAATLARLTEVCTVPEAAQKVMQLTRGSTASVKPVVDEVSRDPALAAEVLRIANSPFYGQSRMVGDLQRAVVVIGMKELNVMASAMALLASLPKNEPLAMLVHERAVLCATLARFIAQDVGGLDPTDAFLAGLLSEIGALACLTVDAAKYLELLRYAAEDPTSRAGFEIKRYGATSEELGARMLERNHLPRKVVEAVRASVLDNPRELGLLPRIALFSRFASPFIVRAAQETNPSLIELDIPDMATHLGLVEVNKERLIDLCVKAGTAVEMDIPAELEALRSQQPSSPMGKRVDPSGDSPKRGFFDWLFGR
ncbi:MAG: HDOD domain-containing protein [Myxococcota bacterium]|jgi:HD-like signal output (HDOD) protein|nr:HDOD domain-containing protein [Myxococcota bacterium]